MCSIYDQITHTESGTLCSIGISILVYFDTTCNFQLLSVFIIKLSVPEIERVVMFVLKY